MRGQPADPSIHIWNEVFQEPCVENIGSPGSEEGGMNGQMGNGEDTTLSGDFASPVIIFPWPNAGWPR